MILLKKIVLVLCFVALIEQIIAQSISGITGKQDTSFTNYSAYNQAKQKYPDIKLVGEFHFSSVKERRNIVYCDLGKRQLLLDVFYPVDTKKSKTAIIIVFGGGWRSGNRTQHYPLAQQLAHLGYVCFTPDYRLSTEALYPAAVYDIKTSIRWVHAHAKEYNIDSSRIAVLGFSAGGELAAFMGSTNGIQKFEGNNNCLPGSSSWVHAVIDIDGILAFIHPESGEGDDSKKTSAATFWFGYSKTENPGLWKEASSLTYVGKQNPPTLFINSSIARMHAGRTDYINVMNQHNIYTEVHEFENSPHSFCLFQPWFDSTVHIVDEFLNKVFDQQQNTTVITVAPDGSGDYNKVQQALDAIPVNNKNPFLVFIKNGIYREKLHLDASKNYITVLGEDKFKTILTYDDHTGKNSEKGDTINTRTSWSFLIQSKNFKAENITFQNDAGFSAGQAVAVESDGDKAVFRNCRFIGNQDVLFTNNPDSRQYYEDCYIEGTTDFIFGSSTVWFERCHIHSKKNSHVTAASTPEEQPFGYIFNDCVLTGDTDLHNVSLGRPWRPYASVTYIHCYIGQHIKPEGWSNWNNTDNYKFTRYAEYENYGPSSNPAKRVAWSRQLTTEEVKKYSLKNVFRDWNPLQ